MCQQGKGTFGRREAGPHPTYTLKGSLVLRGSTPASGQEADCQATSLPSISRIPSQAIGPDIPLGLSPQGPSPQGLRAQDRRTVLKSLMPSSPPPLTPKDRGPRTSWVPDSGIPAES